LTIDLGYELKICHIILTAKTLIKSLL